MTELNKLERQAYKNTVNLVQKRAHMKKLTRFVMVIVTQRTY